MKKIIISFILGSFFSSAIVIYAADSVKAVLFPVKFDFNGVIKDPHDSGYEMLNYNNHTYVPIRYVAENMGVLVYYNEDDKKVIIADNNFNILNKESGIKAGNIRVTKSGNHSIITGQLYVGADYFGDDMPESSTVTLQGSLAFYDANGNLMERVAFIQPLKFGPEQIHNFKLISNTDLSKYAVITIPELIPEPKQPPGIYLDPLPIDKAQQLYAGLNQSSLIRQGEYTISRLWLQLNQKGVYSVDGSVIYFDENNNEIGNAPLKTKIGSTNTDQSNVTVEVVGKGDFTKYKSYKIIISSITAQ